MIGKVILEMERQDEKWGEQNHPLIGGNDVDWWRDRQVAAFAGAESYWKRINDRRVEEDTMGWDSILLEEVYEALAATEPADQVTELLQVAAVAIQAAKAIERAA